MRKFIFSVVFVMLIGLVTACGGNSSGDDLDDLAFLEVEFEPQETAKVGETVELVATVTYDDDFVTDADEMEFEYWIGTGDEDPDERESTFVDGVNNNDGTYSVEVTFEEPGEYWIYAHTTARDQHTMPKRSIVVEE